MTYNVSSGMLSFYIHTYWEAHLRSAEVYYALSSDLILPGPTLLSTNSMNRVFAFSAEAGPHSSTPEAYGRPIVLETGRAASSVS